ncbi:hypothetical protein EC912_10190 [Luteibacter rhizovicinus]|uniref:Uncharacterized protein n=1 Tax=Luteibacter rhizovicinus TaxID=242606 RepID=A0A4R3YVG2_9GAMM|nr:hypothetical protein [Luteibacter rhizovicinus]TCV97095.1 hypothetical protein EC912_10190 [Luteibacter rhizovicinus]
MVSVGKISRLPLTTFASAAIVAVCLGAQTHAQQSCVPSAQDAVTAAIESCIQILREEPVGKSYPESPATSDAARALGMNHMPPPSPTGYTVFNVGDAKFSAAFTHCINEADPAYSTLGSTILDNSTVDLPVVKGEKQPAARYQYTNKYRIHELRDRQTKILYVLVRIARSGSIETLGDAWENAKPSSISIPKDCRNSYGDPCGTRYSRNRAGAYEKL